jgi:hypothetical protein
MQKACLPFTAKHFERAIPLRAHAKGFAARLDIRPANDTDKSIRLRNRQRRHPCAQLPSERRRRWPILYVHDVKQPDLGMALRPILTPSFLAIDRQSRAAVPIPW